MSTSQGVVSAAWSASPTPAPAFMQSANGLGTGLTTLRERLQLIFGDAAQLRLAPNGPRGAIAEIDMPAQT